MGHPELYQPAATYLSFHSRSSKKRNQEQETSAQRPKKARTDDADFVPFRLHRQKKRTTSQLPVQRNQSDDEVEFVDDDDIIVIDESDMKKTKNDKSNVKVKVSEDDDVVMLDVEDVKSEPVNVEIKKVDKGKGRAVDIEDKKENQVRQLLSSRMDDIYYFRQVVQGEVIKTKKKPRVNAQNVVAAPGEAEEEGENPEADAETPLNTEAAEPPKPTAKKKGVVKAGPPVDPAIIAGYGLADSDDSESAPVSLNPNLVPSSPRLDPSMSDASAAEAAARLDRIEASIASLAKLVQNQYPTAASPALSLGNPGPGLFKNVAPGAKSVLRLNPPIVGERGTL
ncbi:hypothetical protein C8R43DRAFT_1122951 [Mycena crocata]|nr:hypothetical protein C8R43DRAFT_1122951 [Mycena crocata]